MYFIVIYCGEVRASVMCRDWCRTWSQFQQEGVMNGHSLTWTVSAETRVLCRLGVDVTRCDVATAPDRTKSLSVDKTSVPSCHSLLHR